MHLWLVILFILIKHKFVHMYYICFLFQSLGTEVVNECIFILYSSSIVFILSSGRGRAEGWKNQKKRVTAGTRSCRDSCSLKIASDYSEARRGGYSLSSLSVFGVNKCVSLNCGGCMSKSLILSSRSNF